MPVFIWTGPLRTDAEYATLATSARAIVLKGGGALHDVLETMRRSHRLPAAAVGDGDAP